MEEKASRFSQVRKEKEISDVVSRLVGQFYERTLVNLVLAVLFGRQSFHDFLQRFDVFLRCLETRQVQFRKELRQSRILDISRCLQRNTLSECRTTLRKALVMTSFSQISWKIRYFQLVLQLALVGLLFFQCLHL